MGSVSTVPTNPARVSNSTARPILLLPHPRVESANNGTIEGFRHQLSDGRPINVFLGIPYAKPPMGELRFRKPLEPDSWHPSVLKAKRYRARSIQMAGFIWDALDARVGTSEDCLYLNVIAPGWSCSATEGAFPVMMYIHGGGYLFDSAAKYHYKRVARTLVHHGVILVTIQYRLGLLGYFCTGDRSCAGNFGLWDQFMALKWVRENATAFSGDPQRITVFGQSAGAAATDMLALSPLSRKMFSRAILMGGNAECAWAMSSKAQIVPYCREWALKLGFKTEKPVDQEWGQDENEMMMAFLRGLPAGKFVVNAIGVMGALFDNLGRFVLAPVVDGELLPATPRELRKQAPPKQVIAGTCKYEGMLFLALGFRRANAKLLASFERQIQIFCTEALRRVSVKERHAFLHNVPCVLSLYGIHGTMRADKQAIARACVTIMSDFTSSLGMHNFCACTVPTGSTVYRFLFEHYNPDTMRTLNPFFPFKGATHATELAYVFDVNMFVVPWRRTKADKEVLAMVTRMWTNFAKCGDPNQSDQKDISPSKISAWKPLDEGNVHRHLCIATEPRMVEMPCLDWHRIEQMAPMYRTMIIQ